MATGESIKHFIEIESLLTAICCPKEVAVMPCKGHSRDWSKVAKGNQLADCQARKAVLYEIPYMQTTLSGQVLWNRKKHNILRKN